MTYTYSSFYGFITNHPKVNGIQLSKCSLGPEFSQGTMGMFFYLLYNVLHLNRYLFHKPLCVRASLGFLTAWYLGCKDECPERAPREAATIMQPNLSSQ